MMGSRVLQRAETTVQSIVRTAIHLMHTYLEKIINKPHVDGSIINKYRHKRIV